MTSASDSGGDVDLFVNLNSKPEMFSSADCSSATASSNEACALLSPDGATTLLWASVFGKSWFGQRLVLSPLCLLCTISLTTSWSCIFLAAFRATQGVTLTCTTSGFPTTTSLSKGQASNPISLALGEIQVYLMAINSEGAARVTCQLVGDNGNLDLFLVFGDAPYFGSGPTDCSSRSGFSDESCVVESPNGGSNLFITVQAFADALNAVLTCFVTTQSTTIALQEGIESDPVTVEPFGAQLYTLDVTQGTIQASCSASAIGEGNFYLRWGSAPDLAPFVYDCFASGFSDSCEVTAPPSAETVLWVLVDTSSGLEGLTVSCTSSTSGVTSLVDGVPSQPVFLSSNQTGLYTLEVFPGA